ncbi:peptidyl-prolyl cis-trans isomerase FKBP20-1 [Olea europaea subsp. europaea]|uniref:peptidylprolyl isomerase n=1 Tax=Olea europaea subsp. europaea TaxID=158383 RepID=A0A8S0TBR7_OLEEU|nr:peptidyl-prolyl cis-trans isomerase FKBP20-1 [Olea europaea subsp. europaea]
MPIIQIDQAPKSAPNDIFITSNKGANRNPQQRTSTTKSDSSNPNSDAGDANHCRGPPPLPPPHNDKAFAHMGHQQYGLNLALPSECRVSAPPEIHYEGVLAETGEVFDATHEDNTIFTFELGQGSVIKAWDIALKTMKVGEVAKITCKPEYAIF